TLRRTETIIRMSFFYELFRSLFIERQIFRLSIWRIWATNVGTLRVGYRKPNERIKNNLLCLLNKTNPVCILNAHDELSMLLHCEGIIKESHIGGTDMSNPCR